ncbi:TetR/AcrR family transcriptional regulator [Paeniglutamicibacter psychrophenolicus]|uniref:AcrR family transcriptional regulator n=1 Tax=Paeniglutamicibacter psychrophenolicus TaxID=257454 RepID=A0ABS4W7H2_9MICC|nr:TetR/AcrR family transcriptional regulator [Paeniglutamicibacter psychrophenolicus]MBP2372151.1 AcrR family transcriptional regulator [Paeniglutamicibacter psychrophenolicus]
MSEPSAPRTRVRATDSKHRLFTASMELIGARGHHEVSVDEIAKAAGVSKGTVYYNFGSKSELIGELLNYGAAILFERFERAAEVPDAADGLRLMIADALEFIAEYPSFAQLWISEQWQADSDWAAALATLRHEVIALVRNALARMAADGPPARLAPAVDLGTLATAIFGAALILGRDRLVFHPERSVESCVEAVMAFTAPLR